VTGCATDVISKPTEVKSLTLAELTAAKCLEINKEVKKFESQNEVAVELAAITALQKKIFLIEISRLYESGKISLKNWKLFQSYATYELSTEYDESSKNSGSSEVVGPPPGPSSLLDHLDDSITLAKLLDYWIEIGLVRPYLFESVVKRGNALAAKVPAADQVILDNPECFSESRVSLVRSVSQLRSPDKSNWGKPKTGSELLAFLD
jgi:hypothetical protein